jgi:hypothetical protein
MSEDKKGFSVNDRRHFAPDGSVRGGSGDDSEPASEAVSLPSAPEPAQGKPRPATQRSPQGDAGVDLSSFLLSLAGQASVLLGLTAPRGEAPKVDLPGARAMIGILEMLQAKTEGRRTPEEDELLEGVLYELRTAYLARTRGGA